VLLGAYRSLHPNKTIYTLPENIASKGPLEYTNNTGLYICVVYIAACGLSALVFIGFLYRLLRRVIRGAKSLLEVFGTGLQQQLISLGLTCLVFPSAVTRLTQNSIQSLGILATTVSTEMYNGWGVAQVLCDKGNGIFLLSH
jgi:hypothetical protein